MRTSTRGVRRGAVAGGWAAVAALVWVGGCARRQGTAAEGVRPVSDKPAAGRSAAGRGAAAGGRYAGGPNDSVPIGYGSVERRRMTGSVATVSGDVTRTQRVLRVEELLYRVPGVTVVPRGDGSYSITIRGRATLGYNNTDPLFVVDGMPVENGIAVFRSLAPEDVERIDVIKDAEASIYGSRSANGVILVRTRHAKASQN